MVSSIKAQFSRVTSIVISVTDSSNEGQGFMNCKSCLYTCHIPEDVDPNSIQAEKKAFRGCQQQFGKAHQEANEVVKFFKEISANKCNWLYDPSPEGVRLPA